MRSTIAILCLCTYFCGAFILGIAISSWMLHINANDIWQNSYTKITASEHNDAKSLMRSWTQKPFVDVFVTDATKCPTDFPEDLIYDIWRGSRGHCDCLEYGDQRGFHMDQKCGEPGVPKPHVCHEGQGLSPIVMNRFAGVRYCGKLS